jgi:hypothetical protein
MRFDTIWLDARLATLSPDRGCLGRCRARRSAAAAGVLHTQVRWRNCDRLGCDQSHRRGRALDHAGLIDCHTTSSMPEIGRMNSSCALRAPPYGRSRGRAAALSPR